MTKLDRPEINTSGLTAELRKAIDRQVARSDVSVTPGPNDGSPSEYGDSQRHDSMAATPLSTVMDLPPLETQSALPSKSPRLDVPSVFVPRADDHYEITDLLKFHDVDFLNAAYLAILKRKPDSAGYNYYLEQLREGHLDKVDILASLRFCPEGDLRNVRIEGLVIRNLVRRLGRLPLVGYLVRLSVGLVRLPVLIHRLRRQEAHSSAQNRKVVDYLNNEMRDNLFILSEAVVGVSQSLGPIAQQQEYADHQIRTLFDQQQVIVANHEHVDHQIKTLVDQHQVIVANLDDLNRDLNIRMEKLRSDIQTQTEVSIKSAATGLTTMIRELEAFAKESAKEIKARTEKVESTAEETEAKTQAQANQIRAQIEHLSLELQNSRAESGLQGTHLSIIMEEARKRLPEPFDKSQLEIIASQEQHKLDALYAELEDNFRGSRDEIKQRFTIYLPHIESLVNTEDRPIVDLGCGRGEWLELLKEAGFKAFGVDTNSVFLDRCRALGLDARESDALTYLRGLPGNSLSAVTGFHIAEHLEIEVLIKLIDEIVRVLHPGGVVIFETPNPDNVLVGSNYFYFDPTHRNPLPSLLMKLLLESRGLHRIEVMNLHAWDEARVGGKNELAKRFNELFYGPMDYAIAGWKVSE